MRNLDTSVQLPFLLYFISPTSGRCRKFDALLAQVLQGRRNHDTFRLVRVDVEQRPALAERFRISETPTLIVVDDNRVQARLAAPDSTRAISEVLSPWLR